MSDDELVLLSTDQGEDSEFLTLSKDLVIIANGTEESQWGIPFCMIWPKFSARENCDPRYRITARFRKESGAAAMRTRILGMLLASSGYGDDQEKELWRRWMSELPINEEPRAKSFFLSLNQQENIQEHIDALNERYAQLERTYQTFWDKVDEYDIGKMESRPAYYNFAFYERWTQQNGQWTRSWRFLGDKDKFQYDLQRPMYNLIRHVVIHDGIHVTGMNLFRAMMQDATEDYEEPKIMEDPALLFYERLCYLFVQQHE